MFSIEGIGYIIVSSRLESRDKLHLCLADRVRVMVIGIISFSMWKSGLRK
jgi:uncharacterized protein YhhL (DUF1145 family)